LVNMSIESPQLLITLNYLVMIFQIKGLWRKFLLLFFERFESKITSLEESKDLNIISLGELISALQAQEQKISMRQENVT